MSKLPSVSTVIDVLGFNKRVLLGWTKKQFRLGEDPDAIADRSKKIGTATHELIQKHLVGEIIEPDTIADNEVKNAFLSFLDWVTNKKIACINTEMALESSELGYHGIIDFFASVDDKFCVIDWKTGNYIHLENKLQIVAYKKLLEKFMLGTDIGIRLVRLDKDKVGYEEIVIERDYEDLLWKGFQYALELYNWKREIDKRGKE